jgi:hypothetical protein
MRAEHCKRRNRTEENHHGQSKDLGDTRPTSDCHPFLALREEPGVLVRREIAVLLVLGSTKRADSIVPPAAFDQTDKPSSFVGP